MNPAALHLLQRRQARTRLALDKALKARKGGIAAARRAYVKATADVLRAGLKSRRITFTVHARPDTPAAPDLFSQSQLFDQPGA